MARTERTAAAVVAQVVMEAAPSTPLATVEQAPNSTPLTAQVVVAQLALRRTFLPEVRAVMVELMVAVPVLESVERR